MTSNSGANLKTLTPKSQKLDQSNFAFKSSKNIVSSNNQTQAPKKLSDLYKSTKHIKDMLEKRACNGRPSLATIITNKGASTLKTNFVVKKDQARHLKQSNEKVLAR